MNSRAVSITFPHRLPAGIGLLRRGACRLVLLLAMTQILRADGFVASGWREDATSGAVPGRTLWGVRLGSSQTATLNGVNLTGVAGSDPAVAEQFSLTSPGVVTNPAPAAPLGSTFVFGGNPATLTVQGLQSGTRYTVTMLSFGWSGPELRVNRFQSGNDALDVDQQVFGSGGRIRVDYTFTANAATRAITVTPLNGGTWHFHAVMLQTTPDTLPHAIVVKTDDKVLPVEFVSAVQARAGQNVWLDAVHPSGSASAAVVNGARIADLGTVQMPRFDSGIELRGEARHYVVAAGDFTLRPHQSLWAWGDRLLKLEFGGSATFEAGSLVVASAVGRLGGAGGGDGGDGALSRPVLTARDLKPVPPGYAVGTGGVNATASTAGEAGQRVAWHDASGQLLTDEAALSPHPGAAGQEGQGASRSGVPAPAGGGGLPWSGSPAAGGAGGQGGAQGYSNPLSAGSGLNGSNGGHGSNGAAGANGGDGQAPVVNAAWRHLRGGSGGGAGAGGGNGQGGGTGGCGGGGGAAGTYTTFLGPEGGFAGGNGGLGGTGGAGGQGGLGGSGGGGGGGMQLLVRAHFRNAARCEAAGASGQPGSAGSTGSAGTPGSGGSAGTGQLSLRGGNGGAGGNGGNGGQGGRGGNGAGGAGGCIQIAALSYEGTGSAFAVAGGSGAPDGIVQIHRFDGTGQNAPFGAFAARPNLNISHIAPAPPAPGQPVDLFPTPSSGLPPGQWPNLPGFVAGPASAGMVVDDNLSQTIKTRLGLGDDVVAVAFRCEAADFGVPLQNHDVLVFANISNFIPDAALAAVADEDRAALGQPGLAPWLPEPRRLPVLDGYEYDPAISPPRPGVTTYPLNPRHIWMATIDRNKTYEVTTEGTLYNFKTTWKGEPVRGSISGSGPVPSQVIVFRDTGKPAFRFSVSGNGRNETSAEQTIIGNDRLSYQTFARPGTSPVFTFSVRNSGNFESRLSGNFHVWSPGDGESDVGFQNRRFNDAPSTVTVQPQYPAGTPIQSRWVAEVGITPYLDDTRRTTTVAVGAIIIGPQAEASASSLNITAPGPGVTAEASLDLRNTTIIPPQHADALASRPEITRLRLVRAEIIGDASGAFQSVVVQPAIAAPGESRPITVNFTPPAPGTYRATLRLITDQDALPGQPGRVLEIPLTGSAGGFAAWAGNLPPDRQGPEDDADGDGLTNFLEYATGDTGLPTLQSVRLPEGGESMALTFTMPAMPPPDVRWTVQGSTGLSTWETLGTRHPATGVWELAVPADAAVESVTGDLRTVTFTHREDRPRYFVRVNAAGAANSYWNDFTAAPLAELRGNAAWTDGSLRLTNTSGGNLSAAVLEGVSPWAGQTGFGITFSLNTAAGTTALPGDGVSFCFGDLGTSEWGLLGAPTPRCITVAFDTFENGSGQTEARGIRVLQNGAMLAYSAIDPWTNGQWLPVAISFVNGGVDVDFNGQPVFRGVATPGFELRPGDRFGFGGRVGGSNQISRVDNVSLHPR